MQKIFAIRIGTHVEFRAASRPPRAIVSKLTKSIRTTEVQWENYQYSSKPVKKKLVLKQVYFEGGRVLGVCKLSRFSSRTGSTLPKDGMLEVSREWKDACLRT